MAFYESKDIYTTFNPIFFDQADLTIYSRDIYTNVTLLAYLDNDPIEVHKVKLREINSAKQQILIELEVLKNGWKKI